jgi:transposase
MNQVSTIGFDTAKHVFQAHGRNREGHTVFRRKLRRKEVIAFFASLPPCLVGMEACGGAHCWARQLRALGHDVRLMPAACVKPYVSRQKNDGKDAEGCCEAVGRPNMRFVPIKSEEQQSVLMLHRARELLVRQRTMLMNALRGHLAEFGIIARQGRAGMDELLELVESEEGGAIPELARSALVLLAGQLRELRARINALERQIHAWHRSNAQSRRLETAPGIGPITASAIVATVADPSCFKSGRHFAAWLGLVPRQNSSGGKERLGRITRAGDPYLRRLLVVGAHAVLRFSDKAKSAPTRWAAELLNKKHYTVAAVALANKMARVIWAMMMRREEFRADVPA